jgi:4-hydroxy-tetrahydrodipicolinate reductase
MKIALIGYGKMGKAIEQIALEKGHEIVLKIGSKNLHEFTPENIKKADVAIECSTPETAFENVKKCLENGVCVTSGTTAWQPKMHEAEQLALTHHTAILIASNYSIGVNIFFAINEHLAKMMAPLPQYNVSMQEVHHTAKLDSPSGTAVTLAQGILAHSKTKTSYVNHATNVEAELAIISQRVDPAPGTHSIVYDSPIDTIEIIHTAHSRIGFASGAVLAAEFIAGKSGVFSMKEVLGISK